MLIPMTLACGQHLLVCAVVAQRLQPTSSTALIGSAAPPISRLTRAAEDTCGVRIESLHNPTL